MQRLLIHVLNESVVIPEITYQWYDAGIAGMV